MKRLQNTLFVLCLLSVSALYGWDIRTDDSPASETIQLITQYSTEIARRCEFTTDTPVYVPVSNSQLIQWLADRYVSERQYLLVNTHYEMDRGIVLRHRARFCGLNDWLNHEIPLSSGYINTTSTATTDSGSGGDLVPGGYDSLEVSEVSKRLLNEDVAKTRVSFWSYDRFNPSLLILKNAEFNHLVLAHKTTTVGYGLIGVGCTQYGGCTREYTDVASKLTLKDSVVEDRLGISDYLIWVHNDSRLTADNTTFNFTHHKNETNVIYMYLSDSIQINHSVFNNFGYSGRVFLWDNFWREINPNFIVNTVINSFSENTITAFWLNYRAGSRVPWFSNVILNPGVTSGLTRFTLYEEVSRGDDQWVIQSLNCYSGSCPGYIATQTPEKEPLNVESNTTNAATDKPFTTIKPVVTAQPTDSYDNVPISAPVATTSTTSTTSITGTIEQQPHSKASGTTSDWQVINLMLTAFLSFYAL